MEGCTLASMIKGHEIWLDGVKTDNPDVELFLSYGHNMRRNGLVDPIRIKPLVYTPTGATLTPILTPNNDHYLIRFLAEGDGYYTVVVNLSAVVFSQTAEGDQLGPKYQFKNVTYAGAFHQMAKRVIPIGDAGEFNDSIIHGILELVPSKPKLNTGEEVELTVYYEGRPLPAAEVRAVSQKEGKEIWAVKTNEEGTVRGPITIDGEWMFLVRHADPTKKVTEEFDETVFVSTLVMEA